MSVLSGPSGVVATIRIARGPIARMRGLVGRSPLARDEGLLLRPCRRVHTFGMRFAIDAVFCDGDGIVVAIETLRPGAVSRLARRARYCVELAEGRAAECGIDVGTRLDLI